MNPITPNEAIARKVDLIPDEMIEVINELITKNINKHCVSTVKQKDIVEKVSGKLGCTEQKIYDNKWLDVEKIYEKSGWTVEYHKPAWDENFDSYFKFSRKKED